MISVEEYLALGIQKQGTGDLGGAVSFFEKALDVMPNHPAALYSLAAIQLNQGKTKEALGHAERCVYANLFSALAWYIFSASLLANGRPLEALGASSKALELESRHIETMLLRGSIFLSLDHKEQALAEYEKVLLLDPQNATAQKNRAFFQAAAAQKLQEAQELAYQGITLQAAGDLAGSKASLQKALNIHPENFAALYSLAVVSLTLGEFQEGLAFAENCVRYHEGSAMSWYIRGCALKMSHRFQDAIKDLDRALELSPAYKEAHSEKGLACAELDNYVQALLEFNEVLKIEPENKTALSNAAMILTMLKKNEEASQFYAKLLSVDPNYEYALGSLVHARLHTCDWTDFTQNLERIIKGVRANQRVCRPLAFLALSDSPSDQLACTKLFMSISYPPRNESNWKKTPYTHDKLRIGYLSPDLREHPVGHLMAGVFEHHDKSKFEVYSFSLGVNDNSQLRSRFMAASSHFFDVRGQTAPQIAKFIAEQEIDVLIDLAGPTADARPDVLSYHPAPVQVAYLGYAGTTGAPYIDYLIADQTVIPEDYKPHYSEKVLNLPGCYLPTDPEVTISERTPTRAEMSLPENGFVFCSFNHNHKIIPPIFDSWMRILIQVPYSVLWLMKSSPEAEANLRKEAQRRGLSGERLVFAGRIPSISDHLARYRIPGLFLDTSPYNAHSTATDVLRAGLPVLTLEGNSFQSRVATSIVRSIGMPELAVRTLKEYEAFAIDVGNSPEKAATLRSRVEEQVKASESFNPKLKTKALERLYMIAHQRG
jgi:predicted O-linked N-acetylglucosamine transferase (SPINDLY family)